MPSTPGALGRLLRRIVRWPVSRRRGLLEAFYVLGVYFIYLTTRVRSTRAGEEALFNARRVIEWERASGLLVEREWQSLVIHSPVLSMAFNLVYVLPHFPMILGLVWWTYRYRPSAYQLVRNTGIVASLASFLIFAVFPVAPPKVIAELGIVNSLVKYGPVYYEMGAGPFYNALAAVPSLHVVYAVIASTGFAVLSRAWWTKALALTYLPAAVFAVVVTGNHYLADAIAALIPLAAGVFAALGIQVLRSGLRRMSRVPTP